MYESFYGLRELPFRLAPNPRFLVETPRHREALSNLRYAIAARNGISLLVGEAGTGKTTLLRATLDAQRQQAVLCVFVNNPALTRQEFVETLGRSFDLSPGAQASKSMMLLELQRLLLSRRASRAQTLLLVDEAQSMPADLLEEVRLLANLDHDGEQLLSIVLAGQPELADRLNQTEFRQLKQRIALRCSLTALSADETRHYVATRIALAGGRPEQMFTQEAIALIHERSGGIPRTISVLCDNALVNAYALGRKPVGRDVVLDVCGDFDLAPPARAVEPETPRPPAVPVRPAMTMPRPTPAPPLSPAPPPSRPNPAHGLFTSFGRKRFSWF